MDRRAVFLGLAALVFGGVAPALANHEDFYLYGSDPYPPVRRRRRRKVARQGRKSKRAAKRTAKARRSGYGGRTMVDFRTAERSGTIIVKTGERALYYVLGNGRAIRYGVAVGKEGFSWSGVARVGRKTAYPPWTPPAEMIERKPELAEWADGMPGGIPENPLGARAIYLYRGKRDTLFRIHGTNAPSSIGTAASSGCIRMLNQEVIELYGRTRIGTKVIVI
jgi:lipoprotein-anchoring transpeptidase ErfK/SrfK